MLRTSGMTVKLLGASRCRLMSFKRLPSKSSRGRDRQKSVPEAVAPCSPDAEPSAEPMETMPMEASLKGLYEHWRQWSYRALGR